jgi:hypothetical protein
LHATLFNVAYHIKRRPVEQRFTTPNQVDLQRTHVIEVIDNTLELLQRHHPWTGQAKTVCSVGTCTIVGRVVPTEDAFVIAWITDSDLSVQWP